MKAIQLMLVLVAVAACRPAERPDVPSPEDEPSPQAVQDASAAFHTLRDGFLEWYLEAYPVRASELGVHGHAGQLTGLDRRSIQRRIDALLDWDSQLRRIPIRLMRGDDRFDYAVLEYGIRSELLSLEEIRPYVSDPWLYADVIARGVSQVAEHVYAPPAERAEALRSRLSAAPGILAAARVNLRSPPRARTELALDHARLLHRYVAEELPVLLAAEPGWDAVLAGVEPARQELATALEEHIVWLETELLPVSTGQFSMGRYLFARHLLYTEHVSLSLEELDRLNDEAIRSYRREAERLAEQLGPGLSVRQVMDSIARMHPEPGELVPLARSLMEDARQWTVASGLVSVPSPVQPTVRVSPWWARQELTSLQTAGPRAEPEAGAFFSVTPPADGWPEEVRRAHMMRLDEGRLAAAVLNRTFPGRYLLYQHERAEPNLLRQAFLPRSTYEGWAGYAEELALEQGFMEGNLAVRLAQVRRALEAQARWHAVLQVHMAGRPLDQVVARVQEMAFLDEQAARREVLRAVGDPGAMAAAFGVVQIKELRQTYEELLAEQEQEFSLRGFHDRLLELSLPLPLATEALMPPPRQQEAGQRSRPRPPARRPAW